MSYSEIKDAIKNAPKTWLPALLMECVSTAREKHVFRDDQVIVRFVENFLTQTGKSALRDEAVTKMIRDISEEPEGTPEQKHEKGAGV